jgi:histidyl-tRNA synthetase
MAQTEVYNHLLLPIMNELINQGFKVEIIYTGNMSKKFKRANKINASFAILLGEEEVARKVIKLKNLLLGSEQLIDLNQGMKIIKKTLKN